MAVNKPTQIEPSNDDGGKPKRASLLERASGTFGFDRLIPAAVPAKLDSDKAKKFAVKLNLLNGAYNGRDAECSCGIPEVQHVLCEHCVGMTTRLKINPASLVFKEDRT